ncbi:MAG TPA: 30S ribosome-binding factor RbfA [Gemmatimonadaceae bacterium]|nr:30S ribosome-binding factor RbfA [Gemmatimonadaceae bacterium]
MPNQRRADRLAERIREEIATFLFSGAKDPRLQGLVTVTGVDVTPDLRRARVFVSVMGSDEERRASFTALESMAGHLRSRVAKTLRLRFTPEIEFANDESVERAARIETLLNRIKNGELPPDEEPSN